MIIQWIFIVVVVIALLTGATDGGRDVQLNLVLGPLLVGLALGLVVFRTSKIGR